jgi:hypothetical protein
MQKYLAASVAALVLASAGLAQDVKDAAEQPDTGILDANAIGLYADGSWDCADASDTFLGTIVVADLSYAFISPDASVGKYGKLNKDTWPDAPSFFVLNGELKDRFGVVGLIIQGPPEDRHNYSDWTKLVLAAVINEKNIFYCELRRRPAT